MTYKISSGIFVFEFNGDKPVEKLTNILEYFRIHRLSFTGSVICYSRKYSCPGTIMGGIQWDRIQDITNMMNVL